MKQSLLYPRATTTRRVSPLDGMWRFQFDPASEGVAGGWADALPAPVSMPVPASFCDFFTNKDAREYTGDFWYETDFFVPGEWLGRELDIRFGSATHRARVFVNGVEVASHEGGFLPFNARVTDAVRYNEYNRLSVLLNNELHEAMLPAGKTITLSTGAKMAKPYFDFYNYAGLHRPVKLIATPKESVQDYSVVHRLTETGAEIDYAVVTNGEHEVRVEVAAPDGEIVAAASGKRGTLSVPDAQLWSVDEPNLYGITVRIMDGEAVIDEYIDRIGIRTVEVRASRILLNGKPIYLKGFGKHEDADIRGRGLDLATVKRDFECMKWIGANCFRTSHYPYAEEVYQMADEEGILIIDEVPAVGFMESLMNFAAASSGRDTHYFEKPTTPQLAQNHLQAVEEMITRDKNHPCVIAWSLLNEPDTLSESSRVYFQKIFDFAHEVDPQRRPRTFALLMNSKPALCRCWDLSDFVSLNRYYGWYVLGGNEICDAEKLFREEMDQWAAIRGDRPFIFTEYGADTYVSEHKLPSVMWSQEYQNELLEMTHRVFDDYDFVQGELVWNFADFQTTEGIMRVNGNKKGIFTRQRQPKDAAFAFKKRWESLPNDYKSEV